MSMYDALYGRGGHGVDPNEPEKTGFARFCQMVGRDLGQLLGTNLMVCILVLPAALGVSLGVTLLSLSLTLVLGALTGTLAGLGSLLLAECSLRSLQNDPAPWLPRAKQAIASRWRTACALGALAMSLLGAVSFVCAVVFELAARQGYYPGLAILLFLALDMLVLAVGSTLCTALLVLEAPQRLSLRTLLRGAGRMLLTSPGRCVAAGTVMLAGIGGMILLFPVSVFWAVLFGFWLPGLTAMQILFPVLRGIYGMEVHRLAPKEEDTASRPVSEAERRRRSRANWWYYNWGIVAAAAILAVSVVYVVHGMMTTVDPDVNIALVSAEALPDEAVQSLQDELVHYTKDRNGDGVVIVQVNNYTWSADAALTDMNSQMAGAARMNTDLANGESVLWVLQDAEGFEAAYGALSEHLGADWKQQLVRWDTQETLSSLELGSYATAADGSARQDVQQLLGGWQVAVFDQADPLWKALE